MPGDTSLRLHSVSIVVTAEFHNPSILNHGFLVSEGIVPQSWGIAGAISTPPFSVVEYRNGVRWTVEKQKMMVMEICDSSFGESYIVHDLATKYLEKLPHVPYRHLGLNCVVSVKRDDPVKWTTQRFLNPEVLTQKNVKILGMLPRIAVAAHDAVLNLTFGDTNMMGIEDMRENAIGIECNVHHEGPLDVPALRVAIDRWQERQHLIIDSLGKLLGSSQAWLPKTP